MVSTNEMQIETEREKALENPLITRAQRATLQCAARASLQDPVFRKFQSKHANEIITRSLCT